MKPTVVGRTRQGMTPTVEDADVLARIATIIRGRVQRARAASLDVERLDRHGGGVGNAADAAR